jgi:hypothetical protein
MTQCRLVNTDASVELAASIFMVQEAPEDINLHSSLNAKIKLLKAEILSVTVCNNNNNNNNVL